jgi:hypothetical protein
MTSIPSAAAAALLLAAVPPQAAASQECGPGALTLEARAVQTLPRTFGIEGVAPAPGGALALWSAEGEILSIASGGGILRRKLPESIRPAGVAIVPEGLLVLDRYSAREYLLGADSLPQETGLTLSIADGEKLDQAIRVDGAWALSLRDGVSHEFRIRENGVTVYRSAPGLTSKATPRYLVSPAPGSLLLTRITAPFDLIRLTPEGRVDTLTSALPSALASLIPSDSLPNWRALPAVAIDCGVLLTLTDLTADRRLLVRLDAGGQLLKVTSLDAPLGLMARLPGEATVLAARRVGNLELVWYDWRWIRESAGNH